MALEERLPAGRGSGGGLAKTLEALRRAPPGDTLRVAIVALSNGRPTPRYQVVTTGDLVHQRTLERVKGLINDPD
jgi:hypothetical protein